MIMVIIMAKMTMMVTENNHDGHYNHDYDCHDHYHHDYDDHYHDYKTTKHDDDHGDDQDDDDYDHDDNDHHDAMIITMMTIVIIRWPWCKHEYHDDMMISTMIIVSIMMMLTMIIVMIIMMMIMITEMMITMIIDYGVPKRSKTPNYGAPWLFTELHNLNYGTP